MEQVLLYDTTLRDGTQGENISFTSEEKIRIALKLDDLGLHYIEGGWPGSSPRDMHFFKLAENTEFKNAKITAFSSTRRPGVKIENDMNIKALIKSNAACVTIFGKSWDLHVEQIINSNLQENLDMIKETVLYLKEKGREVIYDAEHFFDGYRENRDYALETLMAALSGGAELLVLCDTNGGTLPFEIENAVEDVKTFFGNKNLSVRIGIHTHNDCGLAVANSICAVKSGAVMVQGTINGYGERCGNADLTSIIPVLRLKMNNTCISDENLEKLKSVSRFISETANMTPLNSRPFVGRSAFTHKGGIHVSAIRKIPKAYEHIDPELVGNKRRVLVSDLSGKSNIEYKAKELGIELDADEITASEIVSEVKRLEQDGFQFEAADGSLKILIEKYTKKFKPVFDLISFRVTTEKDKDQPCRAHAIIKISVAGKEEITAADGNGPISALDNALRKALGNFYPGLDLMHLTDFKVRVIDGKDGTSAKVRVLIESRDEEQIWSTIGVSEDIIDASWQALTDSFQYELSTKDKA
ncbi:MAG: citramalate synthase [Desulfobacterales bacterium]|nr:citramalate synthase [Desulfobacterales bacterium]MBT7697246.1 citramalate synthase [Desulfobacterales bacterium]